MVKRMKRTEENECGGNSPGDGSDSDLNSGNVQNELSCAGNREEREERGTGSSGQEWRTFTIRAALVCQVCLVRPELPACDCPHISAQPAQFSLTCARCQTRNEYVDDVCGTVTNLTQPNPNDLSLFSLGSC